MPGRRIVPVSLWVLGALLLSPFSVAAAQESEATAALRERTVYLQRDFIRITDNIYTAYGYSSANISMIVGDTGIVIIDAGLTADHAAAALAAFREVTDLPVAAIIYTHGHGDHTGGAAVFAAGADPQIWARENFGSEPDAFLDAGLTRDNRRSARQLGLGLSKAQRINSGIALAFDPPKRAPGISPAPPPAPTHRFSGSRQLLDIAGLRLELVAAPGETADQLFVWVPESRTLFSGDNFYPSWPNLYAIRGTPYRDVRAWADANDKMAEKAAQYLVPGHGRPIAGKERIRTTLTDYRDAIRYLFDKTVEGMNAGLTPDELVDYVELPEKWTKKDYLREFYGNREWAVRAIFNGYFGWFDGNATNLFSLSPLEEARQMAALAGGEDALLARAKQALKTGDAQWAAQLCDHLIALDRQASEPLLLKAEALTRLADGLLTTTGRNYYLSAALELREEARRLAQSGGKESGEAATEKATPASR